MWPPSELTVEAIAPMGYTGVLFEPRLSNGATGFPSSSVKGSRNVQSCLTNVARRAVSVLPGEVTRLLRRIDGGDREAVGDLLPLVYDELRALAAARLTGERTDHTLQPTALVHEAWLRLNARSRSNWADRKHFFRAAAAVMRHILVDHARQRRRLKRGGGAESVPFDDQLAVFEERAIDLIALDEALSKLEAISPRQTDVIELRFFGGFTTKETADMLGVCERTAKADWSMARAWLLREIGPA